MAESKGPAGHRNAASTTDAAAAADRAPSSRERCDSCFIIYLREIGQIKLLTPQEEIELAARIKNGDQEARDQMIKANLRLVVKIARSYEGLGVPLLDLISEGNIGLMRAVELFDPNKGAKFSSYSAPWIRQAITRALAKQAKAVRLPVYLVEKLGQMCRASARLYEELGREPTDEELAVALHTIGSHIAQMKRSSVRQVSLDAQVNGEDSPSYAETIADDRAASPYEQAA
ncbi:MAG TPA: RNA polymerase sigma factor RpoD/SigA, partial [Candidatus Methylomirabilis sp.]|nr:RNA polymerase sigma factor RpoD/SigA [Candidatus Methylomirabilis sp.]